MSQDNGNWTPATEEYLRRSFPVHRACRDGDIEQLSSLLSTGDFDLYEEDDFYGWSPVHWAAYFGKLQCLMHLLQRGGNFDAPTERLNQTPSHIAAYGGYCQCLKWLLHCGATINRQLACLRRLINSQQGIVNGCDMVSSRFSQSPAHLSAFGGHPQCLYWLVQSKCELNTQDYMGETPIHKAARTGSMECVSLLVSQGASLNIKNYSNCLPSEVAAAAGFAECASYLEKAAQIQAGNLGFSLPSTNGTNPSSNTPHNGRTSPEGQSSGGSLNNFISTNTYHSHPHQAINGTSHHPHIENGLNNNNNQSEDCDMEMEEEPHGTSQSTMSNGHTFTLQNQDVLLNQGVSQNLIGLAGRKRGREDVEEESFKRARQDEPNANKNKLNGWLFNNGHMTTQVTDHMGDHVTPEHAHVVAVSDSMVEHYTSVTMQEGYDSLMVNSMMN